MFFMLISYFAGVYYKKERVNWTGEDIMSLLVITLIEAVKMVYAQRGKRKSRQKEGEKSIKKEK